MSITKKGGYSQPSEPISKTPELDNLHDKCREVHLGLQKQIDTRVAELLDAGISPEDYVIEFWPPEFEETTHTDDTIRCIMKQKFRFVPREKPELPEEE